MLAGGARLSNSAAPSCGDRTFQLNGVIYSDKMLRVNVFMSVTSYEIFKVHQAGYQRCTRRYAVANTNDRCQIITVTIIENDFLMSENTTDVRLTLYDLALLIESRTSPGHPRPPTHPVAYEIHEIPGTLLSESKFGHSPFIVHTVQ